MPTLRDFIIYSTFAGIFSSNFFFNIGTTHFLFFYFLVFCNLTLLWLAHSLWLPRGLLIFLVFILLSGLLGLARGSDSLTGFGKAFLGILPTAIYFCAFIRYMNFDVERCFALYARLTYYVAFFGILYFPFQPAAIAGRLTSIVAEPAEFCLLCIPPLYYYADHWQRNRRYGWRFIVMLAAILLTYSSMGYLGLLLGMYLFGTRYRFGKLLTPALVVLVALGIYSASQFFRMRVDDSVQSLASEDLTGSNNSSFGLVSNVFITRNVFLQHPFTGGGLGSHVVAHDKFASQLVGFETFMEDGLGDLGRWDASSLLLRIISETGLTGLVYAGWFLWSCWPRSPSPERRGIAMALLTYIFLKLLRNGIYFNPEEFFFLTLYAVIGRDRGPRVLALSSARRLQPPSLERRYTPTVPSLTLATHQQR